MFRTDGHDAVSQNGLDPRAFSAWIPAFAGMTR